MNSIQGSRFSWQTWVVSSSCLMGAIMGGYYLYFDLTAVGKSGDGKPLGKIEQHEAKVKRKIAKGYVWNSVQTGELLYRKDSIQTGRGSAATIQLADGSLLDVGENSLVIMDDTTELSLRFVRGSLILHNKEGDNKISFGRDGRAQVERWGARLIRPEPLARYFGVGQGPRQVTFAWDVSTKSLLEPFTIQVSQDSRFSQSLTKNWVTPDGRARTITTALEPGRYFWRLLVKGAPISEARRFRILSAYSFQLVWPEEHQKVVIPFGENTLRFRWVSLKAGQDENDSVEGNHRIEISTDPDFKRIQITESINPDSGFVGLMGVPEGVLYWRITSFYGTLTSSSPIRQFELKNEIRPLGDPSPVKKDPLLDFPKVTKPDSGTTLNLLEKGVSLEVSWTEVPGAESYIVTFYSVPQPNHPARMILTLPTNQTHISFENLPSGKNLPLGEYVWSLKALDSKKRPGVGSPLSRLTLTLGQLLAPPQIVSPEVQ